MILPGQPTQELLSAREQLLKLLGLGCKQLISHIDTHSAKTLQGSTTVSSKELKNRWF